LKVFPKGRNVIFWFEKQGLNLLPIAPIAIALPNELFSEITKSPLREIIKN
jgi:hypothetical protein